jgi:membrane dipeptidase
MKPTLLFAPLALLAAFPATAAPSDVDARIARVLKNTPLIDGHNDWGETLLDVAGDARWTIDLNRLDPAKFDTDITRLRKGQVGGQFWSVYVPAEVTGPAAIKATLEQIDIIRGIAARYPQAFEMAGTAADIRRIHKAGKIASLLGVEGGSQIDNSLAVLRQYQVLGVRYMTLTHVLHNDWADSANQPPLHNGLTPFGRAVIAEMNRIGMLVDLSHVSPATMKAVLATTKAPVIYSHSSARALNSHPRNVPDDVLPLVAANGGVVMVNYYAVFVDQARFDWQTARAAEAVRLKAVLMGEPAAKVDTALADWDKAHPRPVTTLATIADHIDHIAKVAGHDHVGLGADFDGIPDTPVGLEGVETYPALMAELMRRGWSDADVAKLAGGNVLRVMERAEAVAASMQGAAVETRSQAEMDAPKK